MALDSALQEQERIITMSYALASEASLKSKLVTGWLFISVELNHTSFDPVLAVGYRCLLYRRVKKSSLMIIIPQKYLQK